MISSHRQPEQHPWCKPSVASSGEGVCSVTHTCFLGPWKEMETVAAGLDPCDSCTRRQVNRMWITGVAEGFLHSLEPLPGGQR